MLLYAKKKKMEKCDMKRILLAGIKHETNTFATGTTGMKEYEERTLLLEGDVTEYFAGTKTEYGGMMAAARYAVNWFAPAPRCLDASPFRSVVRAGRRTAVREPPESFARDSE